MIIPFKPKNIQFMDDIYVDTFWTHLYHLEILLVFLNYLIYQT